MVLALGAAVEKFHEIVPVSAKATSGRKNARVRMFFSLGVERVVEFITSFKGSVVCGWKSVSMHQAGSYFQAGCFFLFRI